MTKAQEEVDKAIGRDRLPDFDDLHRIPYITAMIRKAFRWRTVAPVSIPHPSVKSDTGTRKCLGQHFAKQTLFLLISSFLWAFDIRPPVDGYEKPILPSLDPMDWGAFLASPPPMDFQAIIKPRSPAVVSVINQAVGKGI
ncbi:hypothetical protein S7711_07171 [Stachybotrys chartarum IBT 7711]|uniref:Uncharacterized protein n=1 Tax=Stachybotrys chartarum (strain CBS 109288 / IBT 7711) TaxID=1280523 RepID=A0A084BAJ0_STACB|nr:hypothetical protein S7711_07171 [Stachybotrys chartarum IBT 7711]